MSTGDPLAFLLSLEHLGVKLGLASMGALCAELGHPERTFRSVLVAGTNGKGSVTAFVGTALESAGHRVGRYTSPHLERLEERFVVGGTPVETPELAGAVATVQDAVARLTERGALPGPPTFFECCTAAAFELFRLRGVEVALLEVGLGGRLDATNVVHPTVSCITSIALDHQRHLGDSVTAIAREKAGVVRPGSPCVAGDLPAEAAQVIQEVCLTRGAPLWRAAAHAQARSRMESGETLADLRTPRAEWSSIRLGLRGGHQVRNAVTALTVLDVLHARGIPASAAAVRAGLEGCRWPGRLEWRRHGAGDVLLDAAHNPAGARALAAYLIGSGLAPVSLVFGVMADKDARSMLEALAPACGALVLTTAPGVRALAAEDLLAITRTLPDCPPVVEVAEVPEAALAAARGRALPVVAAGSIFLIGTLRGILR